MLPKLYGKKLNGPQTAGAIDSLPIAGLCLLVGCQTYALLHPMLRMFWLGLGLLQVLIFIFFNRNLLVGNLKLLTGWVMFVGASEFFNLLHSAFPFDIRGAIFRVICYALSLAGVIMVVRHPMGVVRPLSWGGRLLILGAWLAVAGGIYLYLRDIGLVAAMVSAQRFAGSDGLHPVGIAYGYSCCIAIALVLILFDKNWLFRAISGVVVILLLRALISTGSRGALIAVAASGGVMTILMLKWASTRDRLSLMSVGAGVAILGFAFAMRNEFIREQIDFYILRFKGLESGEDYSSLERMALWAHYKESFSSWFLLGYSGYAGEYPHNFFYEFWLRFGLLGLAASLAAAYTIGCSGWRMWKHEWSPLVYAAWGVMFYGFVNAQFNLALEFNRGFWIGIGSAAMMAFAHQVKADASVPRRLGRHVRAIN